MNNRGVFDAYMIPPEVTEGVVPVATATHSPRAQGAALLDPQGAQPLDPCGGLCPHPSSPEAVPTSYDYVCCPNYNTSIQDVKIISVKGCRSVMFCAKGGCICAK